MHFGRKINMRITRNLMILKLVSNKPHTVKNIGKELNVNVTTLYPIITNLENKELVRQFRVNKRGVTKSLQVEATERGKDFITKLEEYVKLNDMVYRILVP